jgi:hypothetical protein
MFAAGDRTSLLPVAGRGHDSGEREAPERCRLAAPEG